MKSAWCFGVIGLLIVAQIASGTEEKGEPVEKPNLQAPKLGQNAVPSPPARADTERSKSEASRDLDEENSANDDEKYASGSVCNYCSYCTRSWSVSRSAAGKFCQLCDKDCPCKSKPNCHLCKYCKYCSMCSLCDTVCTPGGVVDILSSTIYNSLPSLDKETKEKVDKDIESARKWIKEYL